LPVIYRKGARRFLVGVWDRHPAYGAPRPANTDTAPPTIHREDAHRFLAGVRPRHSWPTVIHNPRTARTARTPIQSPQRFIARTHADFWSAPALGLSIPGRTLSTRTAET